MEKLTLVRGLPGSGKTTKALRMPGLHLSADDYFMVMDKYVFDKTKIGEAHAWCQAYAILNMGILPVVVDNTFTRRWEMDVYTSAAERLGVEVEIIDLFDAGLTDEELAARNTHGVTAEKIKEMRERWERV